MKDRDYDLVKDISIENAAKNLSKAIQIKTVTSMTFENIDKNSYNEFLDFLEETYPLTYSKLEKEMINTYSPVFIWRGKYNSLKPILLLGHYDVVPVDEDSEKTWEEPAFSGTIKEGYIWGRGALDDKNQVIAILEAVEYLLTKEFIPQRDIYFTFGFDEEVGGKSGALNVAKSFKEKNIEFEAVIDEGGAILPDMIDGLDKTIALIGIGEKGSTNFKITAKGMSGHSSMPPVKNTVGILAKIIDNVEKNPMKPRLIKPVRELFEAMAPYMGPQKLILNNINNLFPFVNGIISKSPALNSLIRTTIVFTKLEGGIALNVLPKEASAYANVRILQGDSSEDVIRHFKEINSGIDFEIEKLNNSEPSPISPTNTAFFNKMKKIILNANPDVIIAPYLMAGGTDSKHYYNVCSNIYRFAPVIMAKKDNATIHSINERISFDNLWRMISFYIELINE